MNPLSEPIVDAILAREWRHLMAWISMMIAGGSDSTGRVQLMDITQVYLLGFLAAVALSLLWSLVLDNNKPPTLSELLLQLFARCLLLTFLVAVIIGFLYLAIGLFRS